MPTPVCCCVFESRQHGDEGGPSPEACSSGSAGPGVREVPDGDAGATAAAGRFESDHRRGDVAIITTPGKNPRKHWSDPVYRRSVIGPWPGLVSPLAARRHGEQADQVRAAGPPKGRTTYQQGGDAALGRGGIREQVLDCLLHEHQLPLCRGPVHVFGRKHLESGAVSVGRKFKASSPRFPVA